MFQIKEVFLQNGRKMCSLKISGTFSPFLLIFPYTFYFIEVKTQDCLLTLSQTSPGFYVSAASGSLLKTLWGKGETAR